MWFLIMLISFIILLPDIKRTHDGKKYPAINDYSAFCKDGLSGMDQKQINENWKNGKYS